MNFDFLRKVAKYGIIALSSLNLISKYRDYHPPAQFSLTDLVFNKDLYIALFCAIIAGFETGDKIDLHYYRGEFLKGLALSCYPAITMSATTTTIGALLKRPNPSSWEKYSLLLFTYGVSILPYMTKMIYGVNYDFENQEPRVFINNNQKIYQSKECLICLSNSSNVLNMPCNHIVSCQDCYQINPDKERCPQCRSYIERTEIIEKI